MKFLRNGIAAALAATAFALAGAAHADIIFQTGNNPQEDEENILFNSPDAVTSGMQLLGFTNQSELPVYFNGQENLTIAGGGQARIEAADGSFNYLNFGVQNGAFGDFILNVNTFGTGQNQRGNATVTVTEVNGEQNVYNWTGLGPGENFLTILAINGQRISNITVTADTPLLFADVRQYRISSPVNCPPGTTDPLCTGTDEPNPVPEPGTLLLLGAGLLGLALRRTVR